MAQHALKGRVYDRDTKKPLRDVIVLFNFSNQQVLTDSSGGFSISNKAPRSSLLFKKLGYASYKLAPENDSAGQVNVYTGKVGSDIHLANSLGIRLQVYDDDIYYILKEHDWDDTSYLYRQRQ